MNTRSKAAINTPEMVQAMTSFKEGVSSVLRQWTALELAVTHQWGGRNSAEKAANLLEEIMYLFRSPDKVYKDVILQYWFLLSFIFNFLILFNLGYYFIIRRYHGNRFQYNL